MPRRIAAQIKKPAQRICTGVITRRGRLTGPASKRKRMKSNWGSTARILLTSGDNLKRAVVYPQPVFAVMHRPELVHRQKKTVPMQVSWLMDHHMTRAPSQPVVGQWLYPVMLSNHSGGTVRDSHPLPSWLPCGRT